MCVCVIIFIDRGRDKTGGVAVQGCSGQVHLTYINVNSSNIPTYIHRTYIHTCIHLTYIHTHIYIYVCVCLCVLLLSLTEEEVRPAVVQCRGAADR